MTRPDWIEEAAKEIHAECPAEISKAVRKFSGEDIADSEIRIPLERIADIIRQHTPQWRDRPTCAGWWMYREPMPRAEMRLIRCYEHDLQKDAFIEWLPKSQSGYYGPIPDPPRETT